MNEFQEAMYEADQLSYRICTQGDMHTIQENYKESNIGTFNKLELEDLDTLNDKSKQWITFITEEGVESQHKPVLNFDNSHVGFHKKIKQRIKNKLKTTPFQITNVLFDTKERITAKMPATPVKPGEVIELEFDWKPRIGNRKDLNCDAMILAEPAWNKRMEWSMHYD